MSDSYVGQILLFPFNFAPVGFAFCQGQILPIAQNTALFSLLGTTYGGDGKSNFALPDLRSRAPLAPGQGPGLSNYDLGQNGGSEAVTLDLTQVAPHTHTLNVSGITATMRASSGAGNRATPVGNVPASEALGTTATYSSAAPDASMNAGAIAMGGTMTAASSGGGQAHQNRQPYLAMNYCIALQGIFPPRS